MSQGYPGSGSYGQSSYGGAGGMGPPPKKGGMSAGGVIGIIAGVCVVLVVVCCGGCGLFGWFAYNQGATMMQTAVTDRLNADPVAQQHLGTVTSCTVNLMAGGEIGPDVYVFDVVGTAGSGRVILEDAELMPDQTMTCSSARLELPDGQSIDIAW